MEVKLAFCLACMLALLATAQANDTYIPSTTGGDNYYNFYGGPSLSASVSGTDEFSRGDTVTLYVDLTNYGRITGFKQDKVPKTATEYALANAEQQEEAKITTALCQVNSHIKHIPDRGKIGGPGCTIPENRRQGH